MGSISVQGVGTISFEDQYLQGIYEMPGTWNIEALKAQTIAARTFAIKYTGNGSKTICTTEACQVFKIRKKVVTGSAQSMILEVGLGRWWW